MKTLQITFFVSFLLLGLSFTSYAQNAKTIKTDQNTSGRYFVDKNKDGICDNVGNRNKNARGRNFVDKNNDGICDNRGNGNRGNGNCVGKGNGKGCGYANHNRRRNDSR